MTTIALKPSDDFFRVYLNTTKRDAGTTIANPKWTIKYGFQDKYKFYKRCIMVVERVDWKNQTDAADASHRVLYIRKTGDMQPNSWGTDLDGMTNIVYMFRNAVSGSTQINGTMLETAFPVQTYNPFGQIGFQITSQPQNDAENVDFTVVTPTTNWGILLTYHFYKE
jgi:hypothetical protein